MGTLTLIGKSDAVRNVADDVIDKLLHDGTSHINKIVVFVSYDHRPPQFFHNCTTKEELKELVYDSILVDAGAAQPKGESCPTQT